MDSRMAMKAFPGNRNHRRVGAAHTNNNNNNGFEEQEPLLLLSRAEGTPIPTTTMPTTRTGTNNITRRNTSITSHAVTRTTTTQKRSNQRSNIQPKQNVNEEMESLLGGTEDVPLLPSVNNENFYTSTKDQQGQVHHHHHGGGVHPPPPQQHQEILSPAVLQSMRQRARRKHQNTQYYQSYPRNPNNPSMGPTSSTTSSPIKKHIVCCPHGCCCFQCIRTQEIGILEYFGKYETLLGPGYHCLPTWPCRARIVNRLSTRIQQLDVTLESKTKDNVFVWITLAIMYTVREPYMAHYSWQPPPLKKGNANYYYHHQPRPERALIKTYALDIVRSSVPKLTIDELFANVGGDDSGVVMTGDNSSFDMVQELHGRLQRYIIPFGYDIPEVPLITEITPDPLIKASMNEINANKRYKDVKSNQGEAHKIGQVKKAEALAEKSYLSGVGLAKERQAIAQGIKQTLMEKESVQQYQQHPDSFNNSYSNKDVMDILLLSLYMDTLAAIGAGNLVLQYEPDQIGVLHTELSPYFGGDHGNGKDDENSSNITNTNDNKTQSATATATATANVSDDDNNDILQTSTNASTTPDIPDLLW